MKSLRPHQTHGHELLRDGFRTGKRRGLLVCPTGGGKTILALEMLRLAAERGKRGLFLCDRRVLVSQAAREAREYGIDCGTIMANASGGFGNPSALVQFASKDTLLSWQQRPSFTLPAADLVVTDEAHRSAADTWSALLAAYPDAWEVGLTATPARGDGKGLGRRYEFLAAPTCYSDLIAAGVLTPAVCFAPGSKVLKDKAKRPERKNLVGDVVGWWEKLAPGRRTFVFASGVAHSLALRDEFRVRGIPAEHLDGNTPDDERDAVLGKGGSLARADVLVVCSCSVLKYGVDVPSVECVQIADGFGSLVDYLQACGRGLRASPGKENCIIIDHSGCVLYHGFPDADRDWELSDDRDMGEEYRADMGQGKKPKPLVCPECFAMFSGRADCPACGWKPKGRAAAEVGTNTGQLFEVEREKPYTFDASDLDRGWASCVFQAAAQGRTLKAAAAVFSKKYGRPPWGSPPVSRLPERWEWDRPASEFRDKVFRKQPAA